MGAMRRIGNLFRRPEVDREIDDELQSHIDLATEAKMRQGLPQAVARRDALPVEGRKAAAEAIAARPFPLAVRCRIRWARRGLARIH